MHELSIAMSIVDIASVEAEKLGNRVIAVHLKLGPLSGVVKEALESCYAQACEETPLAGSKLVIEEVPITAWCSNCDCLRPIKSMQEIRCPVCRSATPDIRSGRELEVVTLEVVDSPSAEKSAG